MAINVSGKVWELDLDPIDKLVLLALTDHADSDGRNIRPGNALLCAKTGLSERTISTKIAKFIDVGILEPTTDETGRGHVREFEAHLEGLPRQQYFVEKERQKVARRATFRRVQKVEIDDQKVEADAGKVETDDSALIGIIEPSGIVKEPAAVTTVERAMEETAAVREIAVTSEKAYSEAMSLDVTVREACGLSNVWDNGTERRVCSTVSALQAEGFTSADVKAYRATRKKTPNLSYLLTDMIAWRNANNPMPVKTGPVFNKPANWDSLPSLEKKSILAQWAKETFPQTAIV